jgi:hypothetical protein
MTQPAPHVIEAAKEDMYREAALWDDQSATLAECASQASRLTVEAYDVFLYNDLLADYNEITEVFARLCSQGERVTQGIAHTLRYVADTYEEADHTIQGKFNSY